MASTNNRSPWAVTVRNQPSRYREFRYDRLADAEAYVAALAKQDLAGSLKRLENAFQVVARDKGYKRFCAIFNTLGQRAQTVATRWQGVPTPQSATSPGCLLRGACTDNWRIYTQNGCHGTHCSYGPFRAVAVVLSENLVGKSYTHCFIWNHSPHNILIILI